MNQASRITEAREQYSRAALLGERALARSVLEQAIDRGIGHADLYLEVLTSAQVRMGELWHRGEINTAQEHLATTITMEMMDLLRQTMAPRKSLGLRALVTPVEGDQHYVGARIVADFLLMDGWEVDFLGNGTPAADLAAFVQQRRADLVALSATMPELLLNARVAADAVRALPPPRPKVLLGGAAIVGGPEDPDSLGCDAIARSAIDALAEARRLVGLTAERATLEEQLAWMGQRIKAARTRLRMTQRDLADASSLERSYISSVEHGRQNLTIGAVLKIAHALDVAPGELLAPPAQEGRSHQVGPDQGPSP